MQQMTAAKERMEDLDELGWSYLHLRENEAPQLSTTDCKQGFSKMCKKQNKHQRSTEYSLKYALYIKSIRKPKNKSWNVPFGSI